MACRQILTGAHHLTPAPSAIYSCFHFVHIVFSLPHLKPQNQTLFLSPIYTSYISYVQCNDNHHDPIDRFGVVAAMSRNLVIGMDGKIPWRVPQDRALFKQLTRDKILIVGRNTFEEAPNQCHIDHTRYCIVVSNSLETLEDKNVDDGIDRLKLARSFKEALDQAKKLSEHLPTTNLETTEDDGLVCWVGGGENIYEEAIRHPSAKELHLSTIDLEIDIRRGVARFPAKHRWDNNYTILSTNRFDDPKESDTPAFSYSIWKRKTRGGR